MFNKSALNQIMDAARVSPSGKNRKSWRFTVNGIKRAELHSTMKKGVCRFVGGVLLGYTDEKTQARSEKTIGPCAV